MMYALTACNSDVCAASCSNWHNGNPTNRRVSCICTACHSVPFFGRESHLFTLAQWALTLARGILKHAPTLCVSDSDVNRGIKGYEICINKMPQN
jgi:hypothetical protein